MASSEHPPVPQSAREILESMTDAFVALDLDWRYLYVNRRAGEMFGRDPRDLIGRHIWTDFPEGIGKPYYVAYQRAMRDQRPEAFEHYLPLTGRWYENRLHPSPGGLSIFFQDITERKLDERELERAAERYRVLANAVSTVVWRTDPTGRPIMAERWRELTGRPIGDDEWLGVVHPDDIAGVEEAWRISLGTGAVYDRAYRIRGADDSWRHVHVRGVPVLEDGRPAEWIGVLDDITEQTRAEAALRRAALEDALTGLPNRAHFVERLEAVLARREPDAAVLYIDVDRFKAINDTYGHDGGDRLLRVVAARLRGGVRPSDVIGRLSGDEFAVICDGLSGDEEAVAIARRLCRSIAQPLADDDRMAVSASIGVAFASGEEGADAETLMRAADSAMYRAKSRDGGLVDVFDDELRARLAQRDLIERELRTGLDSGALAIHYQPIVPVDAAGIPSAEALLRWQRPGGPALNPAEAVSVAEQIGLIAEIGDRVLRGACLQAREWREAGMAIRVSVNVSARQLARPDELVGLVRAALGDSGLPPELLALEITESVLMEDMRQGEAVLRTLRSLGVALEIDDFGVGYSSLSYLHRLPVDCVKIDSSFVAGLPDDRGSARILQGVVALTQAFALNTTAEGVETPEQLAEVRAAGCTHAQGYLLGRPVPAGELPAALRRAREPFAGT